MSPSLRPAKVSTSHWLRFSGPLQFERETNSNDECEIDSKNQIIDQLQVDLFPKAARVDSLGAGCDNEHRVVKHCRVISEFMEFRRTDF